MYVLGVDIGTTFTAAAILRDDHAEVVPLGGRSAAIPSVVLQREDGTILTGDPALRRGLTQPQRLAREFKRRFGDPTPLLLGETPFTPEELTARVLHAVVEAVTEREGEAPSRICLTHPAGWGPFKRDLFERAAARADVTCPVTLISEPAAAAAFYAHGRRPTPGSAIAVYDLGGGTFDVTVLRSRVDGFDLLGAPEGIDQFGGIDIDAAVFDHVISALGDRWSEVDEDDSATLAAVLRLRADCVDAKEALSADTDVTIPVVLPTFTTTVRLTRAELEAMVRPMLRSTLETLNRAVESANLPLADLQAILLVGGASRMPVVAEMIGAEIGRPIAVDAHPKHSVCLGAAYTAASAGQVESARTRVFAATSLGSADTTANLSVSTPPSRSRASATSRAASASAAAEALGSRAGTSGSSRRDAAPGPDDPTVAVPARPAAEPPPSAGYSGSDHSGPPSKRPGGGRATADRSRFAGLRNRRVLAAAIVMLALALVGSGWFLLPHDEQQVTAGSTPSTDPQSALVELQAIAEQDRPVITGQLWSSWVPQISQRTGEDYSGILAEHEDLANRVPNAVLIATDDYPHVFLPDDNYSTLAPEVFVSAQAVFDWCGQHDLGPNCVARRMTDSGIPIDNTAYPPTTGDVPTETANGNPATEQPGAAADPAASDQSTSSRETGASAVPGPSSAARDPSEPSTHRPNPAEPTSQPEPTEPETTQPPTSDPGTTEPSNPEPTQPPTTDPGTSDPAPSEAPDPATTPTGPAGGVPGFVRVADPSAG